MKRRKTLKKWKMLLSNYQKAARRNHKHIALVAGVKGKTCLLYIFSPSAHRADERDNLVKIAKDLSRWNPVFVAISVHDEYPEDILVKDVWGEHGEKFAILFEPHRLIVEWQFLMKGMKGVSMRLLFEMFKGPERAFRACLAHLVRQRVIVITKNSFVWNTDAARQIIGLSYSEVSAKEFYG